MSSGKVGITLFLCLILTSLMNFASRFGKRIRSTITTKLSLVLTDGQCWMLGGVLLGARTGLSGLGM